LELQVATFDQFISSLCNDFGAQEAGKASAMVSATMGKAKLHGLLTDKAQISSPEESMRPTTIVLVGEPVPDYEGLN
jgi:hypothetical protein